MKFLVNWHFEAYCTREELTDFDFKDYGFDKHCAIPLDPENYSVEAILRGLPSNWTPDCSIFFFPEYAPLPIKMEKMPFPSYVVVSDWNCGYLILIENLKKFDYIFTDKPGVTFFKEKGFANVSYWPAYSFNPQWHKIYPHQEKKYDVSFIGNLSSYFHGVRNKLIYQLLTLSDKYKINIEIGIKEAAYGKLLNQSRIVFNKSVRGEFNMRCYEVPACGTLLFFEEDNQEVREIFTDQEHCVLYNQDNLLALVTKYLEEDSLREVIAKNGYKKIQDEIYVNHLNALLRQIGTLKNEKKLERIQQIDQVKSTFHEIYQWMYCSKSEDFSMKYLAKWALSYWQAHPDEPLAINTFGFMQQMLKEAEFRQTGQMQFQENIKFYTEAIQIYPLYVPLYFNLLRVLMLSKLFDVAFKILTLGEKVLNSEKISLQNLEGFVVPIKQYFTDDFSPAIMELYIKYHQRDDDVLVKHLKALYLARLQEIKGDIFALFKDTRQAIISYQQSLRTFNRLSGVQFKLAKQYFLKQQYPLAKVELEHYLTNNKFNFEAQRIFVETLYRLQEYKRCEQNCKEFLTLVNGLALSGQGWQIVDKEQEKKYYHDFLKKLSEVNSTALC